MIRTSKVKWWVWHKKFKVVIIRVLKDLFENKFYYFILLILLKNSSNVTHFHES